MAVKALMVAACVAVLGTVIAVRIAGQRTSSPELRYAADGRMLRPHNYREWVWLSSGLGMSYRPHTDAENDDAGFDNVFANPPAYRSFVETGKWPDKTVLLLEVRASKSRASINQAGHFQGELVDLEAHVKDEHRFPGKWAFFSFGRSAELATMIPISADCYACHEQHGAVDTTFAQFYPTIFKIAKQKGTLSPAR